MGVLFVVVVVLIAAVPKEVWIALAVLAAFMLICWIASAAIKAAEQRRAEAEERTRVERAAQAAAAKCDREEWERREKQSRIDLLARVVNPLLGGPEPRSAQRLSEPGA